MIKHFIKNINDPQTLANEYLSLKGAYLKLNIDIENLKKIEVANKIKEIEEYHEKFLELCYLLSPSITDTNTKVLNGENPPKQVSVTVFEKAAIEAAIQIKSTDLNKLKSKLYELTEEESKQREKKYFNRGKYRDILFFSLGVIVSIIFSTPLLKNIFPSLKDDKIVIELDEAELQLKNQKLEEEKTVLLLKDSLQNTALELADFKCDSLIQVNESIKKSSLDNIKLISERLAKKQNTIDSLKALLKQTE